MIHQQLTVAVKDRVLTVYPDGTFDVLVDGRLWQSRGTPYVMFDGGVRVAFKDAQRITLHPWKTGVGEGVRGLYENFGDSGFSLETILWLDYTRGELRCELIPGGNDAEGLVKEIGWPGPFVFDERRADHYTVLPVMQGMLIPNNWSRPVTLPARHFGPDRPGPVDTILESRCAYMPWMGQVAEDKGYILIFDTPFDAGYELDSPVGGPTHFFPCWKPSLGRMDYRRLLRYAFFRGNYVTMAHIYRQYAKENGRLVTLAEKAVRVPTLNRLIGSAIVHEGIYYDIEPESRYYDHANPEKNRSLVTFDTRAAQMKALKQKWGLQKVYFHMDGWGSHGYDNRHPDIFPPCEAAGGWAGMKRLSDTMKRLNYIFATHDQYRDYFTRAESFDESNAIHIPGEGVEYHGMWYGGTQTHMCQQLAPDYVMRNFTILKEHGIELRGTYLDVFSIVAPEECEHPWHRMTREQSAQARLRCFDWVIANGILLSSEEAMDWAMPSLMYVHHAPFTVVNPGKDYVGGEPNGLRLPLFNLVYHDCLVTPWYLVKDGSFGLAAGEDGFLHCLLNAGAAYLPIEPNETDVARYKTVAALQEQTARLPMTHHEYVDGWQGSRQRSVFGNSVEVTVDFESGQYEIRKL